MGERKGCFILEAGNLEKRVNSSPKDPFPCPGEGKVGEGEGRGAAGGAGGGGESDVGVTLNRLAGIWDSCFQMQSGLVFWGSLVLHSARPVVCKSQGK